MYHRRIFQVVVCVFAFSLASGQVKTSVIEKLPLDSSHEWNQPQFSPDGKFIYYTTSDFGGIWEYSLTAKTARNITTDPQSGFGFALSQDGNQIAYRRTFVNEQTKDRIQEMVVKDLMTGSAVVVASGADISVPTFTRNQIVYSVNTKTENLFAQSAVSETAVLGIENTKIVMSRYAQKIMFDPLGNGSYIWASLSPNKQKLVAYEMDRGTFVCDVDGKNVVMLGRRDAPCWTRDGKWIIFMDDKGDGDQILSSDILAMSPDGKQKAQLTDTQSIIEMYPSCSPTENKIVCSSKRRTVPD